ncbi:Protein N-acetyltransferase, RimJ/RimL family [Micromonospora nigra]|uniref:Protein N-acetyltransferase, RimJ/RimL family n=1 Tax=Micromonospora nigra TaxID=145857 RepID=A0A1C6SG04_9ACTN|nr:GNAT family N-acetyltransferase [Micromonospora nigra]SCL28278.1 Protein N-acetyltransferase, RimJ/RimL family [Micromonospora nigra]
MEPVEIVEDGLVLRPWRATDADPVHRACQDPDIQRWTTVPRPYLPEHAHEFVTGFAAAQWRDATGAPLAVCDAETGDLLGSCGLVRLDPTEGEIGYWTAPWARGQAVAVRATRALARWSFDTLGLRRLTWRADVGNHASRLVALRAGFRPEGELRLPGPTRSGSRAMWTGALLPGEVPAPGTPGPAGPGTLPARRAAVFGTAQPTLFADADHTELRLRPVEDGDLDAIVVTCRDPHTVEWTTVPDPYGRADAESFLRDVVEMAWARGTGAYFTIAGPDDAYAGSVELRISPGDPLVADVGFMTAPHARGRGYQPAALAALCAWGFASLGLARIEWRANVGNTASRRAAEKTGFRFEGVARDALHHRGVRTDAWVAALLPGDLA